MHDFIRSPLAALPASRIREVANAGLGRPDVLAFWFGESDEVTPLEVREAAAASLMRGETFYAHNLGLPELRGALARYVSALHAPVEAERIAVTSSGVSALMVAAQLLLSSGDEAVAVVPVWPNITAQPEILGARVKRVSLHPHQGAWRLDLQELLDAITPATRALLVNAPNNPTGWTLSRVEQQALLDHCRRTGTWIVADEVYERLWWGDGPNEAIGQAAAPSFLDIAAPEDRLIVTQSFSKSFLMTGWRLGWLVLPRDAHGQSLATAGKLLEFNSSCAPVFVQRGALQALAMADDFVPALVARIQAGCDTLVQGLRALPGVELAPPQGGMYAFFRIEGQDDSLALAKRLVAEHGLGLAPGCAFGDEGEGWLRWCFASQDVERLRLGVQRLTWALGL